VDSFLLSSVSESSVFLSFCGFDAEVAERVGEVFEGVVEFVTDIADAEAGALADLFVFEVFVVFKRDELAVVGVEFGNEELEGADGFEAAERLFGIGREALEIVGGVDGGFAFVVAEVVESEVVDRAEKPGARVADIFPVGVEFKEGVLNEVFGGFPLADQAVGISKQR